MSHSAYVIPKHSEPPRPDSLVIRIGRMLTEIRLQKMLTQAELAAGIGSTQATIARIEKGRRLPTISTMERIAEFYGTTLQINLSGFNDVRTDRTHRIVRLGRRKRTTVICRY